MRRYLPKYLTEGVTTHIEGPWASLLFHQIGHLVSALKDLSQHVRLSLPLFKTLFNCQRTGWFLNLQAEQVTIESP